MALTHHSRAASPRDRLRNQPVESAPRSGRLVREHRYRESLQQKKAKQESTGAKALSSSSGYGLTDKWLQKFQNILGRWPAFLGVHDQGDSVRSGYMHDVRKGRD